MAKESAKPATVEVEKTSMVYVRSMGGDFLHLYTNVVFDKNPKKVELDGFLQAQIDAGKLEVVQP
jgi:hypothetical protein